ncbi:MAG: DUF368 domain-containing protein [Planctomycetota bacterium]|nr:DUF368 domain-containing protein [Planctomycetota bacterium]
MARKRFIRAADLANVGRGFLMGSADLIPGVSGGTVALILGIYQRLVTAISRFDRQLLRYLSGRQWADAARHIDLGFVIPLGCGIGLAIGSLATLLHYLIENFPQYVHAGLFGLILASSILVLRMIRDWRAGTLLCLAIGIVLAVLLAGFQETNSSNHSLLYLFFCGTVAITAMILPGISGSFILKILGEWKYVLGHVKSFISGAAQFTFEWETVLTLTVFSSGCIVGLLSFSKVLRWLLREHWSLTLSVLCGFMIGSLRSLWPFDELMPAQIDQTFWLCGAIGAASVGFVLLMDKLWQQQAFSGHGESPT